MRIVYLARASSIHTVRWVNQLTQRGHDIYILSISEADPLQWIDPGVKVIKLPFPRPHGYYLNVFKTKKILRELKPDLLHAHYASGYGTLARQVKFHPLLLSVWGCDVLEFPFQSTLKKRIIKKNLRAADYLASTSHVMKEQTEKLIRPQNPVHITPFGVDCDTFKPIEKFRRSIREDEFIVGTVKYLGKPSGIEYLVRAFSILKENYTGTKRLRLIIAGDGSQKRKLEQLAEELNIGQETTFLGNISHSEIPALLNRFSVTVFPSLWESFGVSIIEASACGLPVITSDVGGLPEVVQDGVTGLIVPREDPPAIAEAIGKLLDNKSLREEMGKSGRQFVLQHYEWHENVDRMEALYKKIEAEFQKQK